MRLLQLPFGVLWRFILVRLDRLVPIQVTRLTSNPPYPFVARIPSRDRHSIPVHISIPTNLSLTGDESLPVHIDFHGGGFFMGSCLEQAPFCALVAQASQRIVISVDYRMGPVHKFPAAIHDAEDVVQAVFEAGSAGGKKLRDAIRAKLPRKTSRTPPADLFDRDHDLLDTSRISLSGFSSGGNLALNLAISVETEKEHWPSPMLRSSSKTIPTLLFYPSFDQSILPHERPIPPQIPLKLAQKMKEPSRLNLAAYLSPTYLSATDRKHVRASPGLVSMKSFHPSAKVFLVLSELDTLSVQSEEWLKRVEQEGKSGMVDVQRCKGMRHGWTQFPDFVLSKEEKTEKVRIFEEAVRFLNSYK